MKILILANFGMGLINFRKELLTRLINEGYEVYVSFPADEYVKEVENLGCTHVDISMERRGKNPLKEFKLLNSYRTLIKEIEPDLVLTYTIKPNVYGGLACQASGIPYIANITGMGSSIKSSESLEKISLFLYKTAMKNVNKIFFQNENNKDYFIKNKIVNNNKIKLIPGSGINLNKYNYLDYPASEKINFLFIGRIMKDKGIEELLRAAEYVKSIHKNVEFNIVGFMEEDYTTIINDLEENGIINYYGKQRDVTSFLKDCSALILPSYHEGLSNVLLESAASGRPVLASNIPGCRETFDEGISGFGFEPKNTESLIEAIERFIQLDHEEKEKMGKAGRKKVEQEFDRQIVVDAYMDEIEQIVGRE